MSHVTSEVSNSSNIVTCILVTVSTSFRTFLSCGESKYEHSDGINKGSHDGVSFPMTKDVLYVGAMSVHEEAASLEVVTVMAYH